MKISLCYKNTYLTINGCFLYYILENVDKIVIWFILKI